MEDTVKSRPNGFRAWAPSVQNCRLKGLLPMSRIDQC